MRVILHVELPEFYVSTLHRSEPTATPRVILREKRVLDVNSAALCQGLRIGMPELEARTLGHGAEFVSWRQEQFRDAQCAWLDVAAELSDRIEPRDQHRALLDLSAHASPLDLVRKLRNELYRLGGFQPRFGLSSVRWIAETMPPPEMSASWELVLRDALESPASYIADWPTEWLTPAMPDHRRRLIFLGYRTIGEVAQVKASVLKGQFGPDGARILSAARGGGHEEVQPLYPPDSVRAMIHFPGALENLEELRRGLARLGRKLGEQLELKGSQGLKVELTIELDSGSRQTLARTFHKPIAGPRGAQAALRLMLPEHFKEPVSGMHVVMRGLERAESRQPGFAGAMVVAERRRSGELAVQALQASLGETRIRTGAQIIEPRRQKVLRAWKEATGWH